MTVSAHLILYHSSLQDYISTQNSAYISTKSSTFNEDCCMFGCFVHMFANSFCLLWWVVLKKVLKLRLFSWHQLGHNKLYKQQRNVTRIFSKFKDIEIFIDKSLSLNLFFLSEIIGHLPSYFVVIDFWVVFSSC